MSKSAQEIEQEILAALSDMRLPARGRWHEMRALTPREAGPTMRFIGGREVADA